MKTLLAVLACAISLCGSAKAELIKFKYTGIITTAFTSGPGGLSFGTSTAGGFNTNEGYSVTGTVTYDTSAPVWLTPPQGFVLYKGIGEITAAVLENGFALATSQPDLHLGVANNNSIWQGNTDAFWLNGSTYDASGTNTRSVGFSLFDSTATAFDGTGLPTHLTLGDFQQARLEVNYYDGDYWTGFAVDINSLELVRDVPEPATGTLLFAGLGLLVGVRQFSGRKFS